VKAAINLAARAQVELEGQEPPAHLAQTESKKMQAVRAEAGLGRRELGPSQPGRRSMR